MVSTRSLQSATATRASSAPTLLPTTPFSTSILSNIRRLCTFDYQAPRGTVPPTHDTTDTLFCTTTAESDPLSDMGRNVDSVQRLFWSVDGRVSPGGHYTNSSILEQAARCDAGDMVENLQPAHLAPEWQERGPDHPRHHGDEGTLDVTRAQRTCHMQQRF